MSTLPTKAVVNRWINGATARILFVIAAANTLAAMLEVVTIVFKLFTEDLPKMIREVLSEVLGVPWSEAEDVSMRVLTAKVSLASGVNFRDLTNAEAVREDLEAYALQQVNDLGGLGLTSLEPDSIRAALVEGAMRAVVEGGNRFIDVGKAQRIAIAIWEKAAAIENGSDASLLPIDVRLLCKRHFHREIQRQWEADHDRVWF